MLRITQKPIIESIIKGAAYYFDVSIEDIKSKSRKRDLVEPRQIIMTLAYCFTTNSLADIGLYIAGRDHSTAIYALRKVMEHYEVESEYAELVNKIITFVNFEQQLGYTFDDVIKHRQKQWKALNRDRGKTTKKDIMQEIFNKAEEVCLALTDDFQKEKIHELKALYNKLNLIKSINHVKTQEANQTTMDA